MWNPLVGIRFRKPTSESCRPTWKKKDEPVFFASCSCYFLFMSFHLKNWGDDIEAREWSNRDSYRKSYLQYFRANARFPSFGGFGRLPRGTCHGRVVWAWTDSSPSWSITYHSSFASGCVMPLLPGCQRGWKVGPGRPHPFPSVRTVNWKFLPSSVCNCFG